MKYYMDNTDAFSAGASKLSEMYLIVAECSFDGFEMSLEYLNMLRDHRIRIMYIQYLSKVDSG
ncbi:MAG: hypothetical protein ACLU4J_03650 [Butyricimonas paravirosa]